MLLAVLLACVRPGAAPPAPSPVDPAPGAVDAPSAVAEAYVHALQALDGPAAGALVDGPSAWWADLVHAAPGRQAPPLPGVDTRRMSFEDQHLWVLDHPEAYAVQAVERFLRADRGLPEGETLSTVVCTVAPTARTEPVAVPPDLVVSDDPLEQRLVAWARTIDAVGEVGMSCESAVWIGAKGVLVRAYPSSVVLVRRDGAWRVATFGLTRAPTADGRLYEAMVRLFEGFASPPRAGDGAFDPCVPMGGPLDCGSGYPPSSLPPQSAPRFPSPLRPAP